MYATTYSQYVIMSVEMNKFSVWLQQEIDTRGWNQAELHRKSGLSRTIISDVLSGKVSPGFDFCVAIGQAFHLPGDQVLRLAGLLPPVPAKTEQHEKLLYMYDQLNKQDQETVLSMMRFLLSK